MKQRRALGRPWLAGLIIGSALSTAGCWFEVHDDPDIGVLTVLWTVDGSTRPSSCAALGADDMEIVLFNRFGDLIAEYETFCEDFGLSVDLFEGRYFIDMTLVDFADRAVTTTLTDEVFVIEDTELVVDVDFPLGSFL